MFKSDTFSIKRIFSSDKPGEIILVTAHNNQVNKLNVETRKTLAKCYVEDIDVKALVWGFGKLAIVSNMSIVIVDAAFETIAVVK